MKSSVQEVSLRKLRSIRLLGTRVRKGDSLSTTRCRMTISNTPRSWNAANPNDAGVFHSELNDDELRDVAVLRIEAL